MSSYRYKGIIFDLDGTLLDTLDDLMNSTNYALSNNGYKVRSRQEIKQFVGNGIKKLIMRAGEFDTEDEDFLSVMEDFKRHYGEHCNDCTRLYEGVGQMLEKLKKDGISTAIVSNKADYAVQLLKNIYFDGLVNVARGESESIRKKPAPDMVRAVLDDIGLKSEECVYVGDSDVDIQTAGNSGMDCISVSWGFRDEEFLTAHGASVIVKDTKELMQLICKEDDISKNSSCHVS